MSPPKKTTKAPVTPEIDELPVVESVGMTRTAKGYVVFSVKSQGRAIVAEEILTDGPQPRTHAENVLKVEIVKRFIVPREEI